MNARERSPLPNRPFDTLRRAWTAPAVALSWVLMSCGTLLITLGCMAAMLATWVHPEAPDPEDL